MGKLAIYELSHPAGALTLSGKPPTGGSGVLVGELKSDEPQHLRTWLEVQLAAKGFAVETAAASVYRCELGVLEALAREFVICSSDESLRQNTVKEAVGLHERMGPAALHLRKGLLELAVDWGCEEAEPLLMAELVHTEAFAEAHALLARSRLDVAAKALAQAELALLQDDLIAAEGHVDTYLNERLGQSELTPGHVQELLNVLEVCVCRPELAHLCQHLVVQQHRSALVALEPSAELKQALRSELSRWLAEHRLKLLAVGVALTAVTVFQHLLVPALLALLVPLGVVGLVVSYLKRKRK